MSFPPRIPLRILAAALLALFTIAIFVMSGIKNATSDEPPHIAAGMSYLATGSIKINLQHPPLLKELSAISMLAGGVRWPDTPDARAVPLTGADSLSWSIGKAMLTADPDKVIFWARIPFILLALMLGALLFLWGRQLFGEAAAVAAVFLYILNPNVLGHSYLVTMDSGLSALCILFLFCLWNYVRTERRSWMIATGFALGAAMCAKFSGIGLLPLAGMLLLASRYWSARTPEAPPEPVPVIAKTAGRQKKVVAVADPQPKPKINWLPAIIAFAVIAVIAIFTIQAIYLFPRDLLAYLHGYDQVYADHDPNYKFFFLGDFGPRTSWYFAGAYLVKEPLASIILTFVGFVVMMRSKTTPVIAKVFVLLPAALLFTAYSLKAANIGIRYIIPVLPFLFLMGGVGLASLLQSAAKSIRIFGAVLCAWLLIGVVAIFPDHISYFNETACFATPSHIGFAAGTRCGPDVLDDSNVDWGGSLKQLQEYLETHQRRRRVIFSHFATMPPEAYGIQYQNMDPLDLEISRRPATYVISAHLLPKARRSGAEWLKGEPTAIVAHAYYVYELK